MGWARPLDAHVNAHACSAIRRVRWPTARAYSGDPAALALALDTIDTGAHYAYSLEERLFVLMPLVHAESVAMLSRAVVLADEMANDAPPELRDPWAFGAQRVRKYHALIADFGRYPGRNAALGRRSSAAELAHLAEEAVPRSSEHQHVLRTPH